MKDIILFWTTVAVMVGCSIFMFYANSSGPGEEEPPKIEDAPVDEAPVVDGGFFAEIKYQHDIEAPNIMFVRVIVSPNEEEFPLVTGGYTQTEVECTIKIRGISVPSDSKSSSERYRPLSETRRERERWSDAMEYVWSLVKNTKILLLKNPKAVDGIVECDVYFDLGGAKHDLAVALVQDDFARYETPDIKWDWGSKLVDAENVE